MHIHNFAPTGLDENTDDNSQKKRFIFRLIAALHNSGSYAFRTEKFANRVAHVYKLSCNATMFPSRVIVAFHEPTDMLNPQYAESYTLNIASGWNLHKQDLLEALVHDIRRYQIDFGKADKRLQAIEEEPQLYTWYVLLAAYAVSSFCATVFFFGGDVLDGLCGTVLGTIVYVFDQQSYRLKGLGEVSAFVASFSVSLVASFFDRFVFDGGSCLYAQLLGGVVWMLPGVGITTSLLELYANMGVFGASKLMMAIFYATQLGFGLQLGYRTVFQSTSPPDSFVNGCRDSIDVYWGFLLIPIAVVAMAIMLQAHYKQFLGMAIVAGLGTIVSVLLASIGSSPDIEALLCAMAVTIFSRLYAYLEGQRTCAYIIGGLITLVPGSVGVRGFFSLYSGDSSNGLNFTFLMIIIGVSLSIGVFISVIPTKRWMPVKMVRLARSPSGDHEGKTMFKLVNPVVELTRPRDMSLV